MFFLFLALNLVLRTFVQQRYIFSLSMLWEKKFFRIDECWRQAPGQDWDNSGGDRHLISAQYTQHFSNMESKLSYKLLHPAFKSCSFQNWCDTYMMWYIPHPHMKCGQAWTDLSFVFDLIFACVWQNAQLYICANVNKMSDFHNLIIM